MIHSCRYEPYDDGRYGHRSHGEDDPAVGGIEKQCAAYEDKDEENAERASVVVRVGVLGDMDGARADKGEDDENEDDHGLIVLFGEFGNVEPVERIGAEAAVCGDSCERAESVFLDEVLAAPEAVVVRVDERGCIALQEMR